MKKGELLLTYGSQEFFDTLKQKLNNDSKFRELGRGTYTATELIVLKDFGVGVWQNTKDGMVMDLKLIPKKDLVEFSNRSDLIYYVDNYDALVRISTGDDSFVSLVLDDTIVFKGSMKILSKIQAPSERMEYILREMMKEVIVPSKIQFQRLLSEHGDL